MSPSAIQRATNLSRRNLSVVIALGILLSLIVACQPVAPATSAPTQESTGTVVIYSGRNENLVGPLIEQFTQATGIQVEIRYGGTPELAATIIEEGRNSPADVFFAQDAGSLGALSKAGILAPLPTSILDQVPNELHSSKGDWVGISGRARVLVYNNSELTVDDLPATVWGLTDEAWRGRVGWAPTNASFQSFVTALRVLEGEDRAEEWLRAMLANDVQVYPNNNTIVQAVATGEVSVGITNHYYLYRFLAEQGDAFAARNHYFVEPNAGSMLNIAGVGMLETARNRDAAATFIEYLLQQEAQTYFAEQTFEYPVIAAGIEMPDILLPLDQIALPNLDLSDLDDLEGTLTLLQEVGALD